jgi:uncharacterized protein (DUF486 family)
MPQVPAALQAIALLALSNIFMTFAWHAHLKNRSVKPWFVAALARRGIAFLEYPLPVPANRYTATSLPHLKILQEVITLGVLVPCAWFYMNQALRPGYLWAAICSLDAAYFMFRS